MDAKEIKSLLKGAREALKEKDFKTALKHCKTIIKSDKNNYNAWVFIGAAAQELDQPDQSEAAFKRAIEISPDQVLAWQGLCNFYEKHESKENFTDLLPVYKKLLDIFSSDKEKKLEIFNKLIILLKRLNEREKLLKVLKSKLDLVKEDLSKEHEVQNEVFKELSGKTDLLEFEKEMLSEALRAIVSHETFSNDDCKRLFSSCIEVLFKAGEEKFSLSLALPICKKFPESISGLEFLCRVAMNMYIDNGTVMEDVESIYESLCESRNALCMVFQGFYLFTSKKYVEAIGKLTEGLKKIEYCVQGWFFLSKSQLLLHNYSASEKSAKTGISIALKNKVPTNILGKLYLLLGEAFCGRENWDAALKSLEMCATYLGQSKDLLTTFCFTLLKIGQISKAETMCRDLKEKFADDPKVLQLEGYMFLVKSQYDDALQSLRKSLSKVEAAFTLHLVGLVLWEDNQREKAFKVFFKAAELDPYFSKNFMYLGHYYRNHLDVPSKACICYKKAFDLNNSDVEIGMSYSHVLKALGEEEENMKTLKIITANAGLGSCKWAWTQLGLIQLDKNHLSDAILSLQNALRADPSSSYGWECLADAYLKRGSYESAIKAFEKVAELNAKAMYPLYQIATIQKMQGFYVESIEKFKSLLEVMPTYVPALIGLSESLVLEATKTLEECLYGHTKNYCQEALLILARVATLKPGLACLWKLAGDACSIPFKLDQRWFPITVPFELHQGQNKENVSCDKLQLLSYSSKFFGQALLIKNNASTLWHDLGISCHYQSQLHSNADNRLVFAKKAFLCLQKAVSLSPNYEAHWTALGVLAVSKELADYAVGQHALIKSLHLNKLNADTWTNLGVFYLEKGNVELAHFAFKKAQSAEPTYPMSWIGQACIAEKVKHSDTLDLFRHATTLTSHNEALIGYSRAVCETLLNTSNKDSFSYRYNIVHMNAVVVASDCAVKFVANNCNCGEEFNMLGLLMERQGIYNASLKAFERSLQLLESSDKSDFVEVVRTNYARLLSVVGQSNESLREFLLLKKVDSTIICSFALALYKDKQYEQSLKLFGQAFEKTKNPGDKSHIKVAMAIVAASMPAGPSVPNPLTLLLESAQIEPKSVPGLLALYANGILKEEVNLILAAKHELHPYKYDQRYSSSAAFLWAAQAFIMKGVQAARNELLKFVHCSPSDHEMWMQTASCLLHWDTKYTPSSIACAEIGVFHGGCKEQASQIFALCQMAKGSRKGALNAAQKAVHISPGKLSNWATLAAACHVADLEQKHVGWMFSFVRKLAKEQGVTADLLGWFIVMEIFHYVNCGNMTVAGTLTKQALSISSFSAETKSCLQILDAVVNVFSSEGNLEPIFIAVKDNPKSFFGWNVLSQLLLVSGKDIDAEKTMSHFAITTEKIFPKWTIYPLLQLAMLAYKLIKTNTEERDKWLKVGEDVCSKAVFQDPTNKAARFLQGLFAIESGNSGLSKRSFEKVLSSQSVEGVWMRKAAEDIIQSQNLKGGRGKEEECQ